jgi:multidrug efflux pump subunit AcrB
MLRQLPPGILPPEIINFSASSVPILQLGVSGKGLSEQQLNDYATNFVRPQLVTVPGAVLPNAYGGKQRSIMVYLDPKALQAKGLAPSDVLTALGQQNVVEPGGTAKIGSTEYDVRLNSSVEAIKELGDLPIRQVNGAMVYVRDVASVADGSIPQTNIVRQDGHRGVLLTVLKGGTASTLSVVKGVLAQPQDHPTRQPGDLRPRIHQRRCSRRHHRGRSYRPHDSALPRIVAFQPHHCDLDSAVRARVRHSAELPRRDHQHHDAWRPLPVRRHPCR